MLGQGEVKNLHCPTKQMWSDVLMKPMQGWMLLLMRSKLLGCSKDDRWPSLFNNKDARTKNGDGGNASQHPPPNITTNMNAVIRQQSLKCIQHMYSLQGCVGSLENALGLEEESLHMDTTHGLVKDMLSPITEASHRVVMAMWIALRAIPE